jgi:hypothetical protein
VTDAATQGPRLNHVAIPVPAGQLGEPARAEILDFYGAVLGWTEGDNTDERGEPLILFTGEFGEFLYLAPTEHAADAAVDHVGMQVATLGELEDIVARARERQASDDRVRVSEISNAYIQFGLPFSVELQHIARKS